MCHDEIQPHYSLCTLIKLTNKSELITGAFQSVVEYKYPARHQSR